MGLRQLAAKTVESNAIVEAEPLPTVRGDQVQMVLGFSKFDRQCDQVRLPGAAHRADLSTEMDGS
jgi:hypothetical protein